MAVTLAQLRAFEQIVRLGSFHAAARHLGVTQPSISQRIRELEAELGVALFTRNGPRVMMTADGQALVEYATRTLGAADDMVTRFRSRDPLLGVLRIGVTETFALICLPDLVSRLEERHSQLTISVTVGDAGMISTLLNNHQLDLGVVTQPDVGSHIHQLPVGQIELGWVAGPEVRLPQAPLTPVQLATRHLIGSPESARLYATMMNWFAAGGAVPSRVSTCNSLSVTIRMVLASLAIGLLPIRVVAAELERGAAVRVPVTIPVDAHRVSLCYQVADFGPSLQSVVDVTQELIVEHRLFRSPIL
ncbi:LysR family transcriptional regulator [Ancylobacter mangrovi]|uniref:LysR family transcriptional regulator n=1 Tax=Ancylobacter mangrovi TaxID=2972472 RepID=UPI0021631839|nr:LysR family transcriptional regulator [Ancylobacter mangrovi]MCS0500830.1 LysR family transcriptional regulator [Ancylobacter mangrovi]